MKPIFIAEIKTHSMFGFTSPHSRKDLIDAALAYGDWISVHTDPRFGGSFDDIYTIRQETTKPILAKGFHHHDDDIKKALDLGANYVLTVNRIPDFFNVDLEKVIFELSALRFEAELNRIKSFEKHWRLHNKQLKFLYNGRNLSTGVGRSQNLYPQFREKFQWLCGASLIKRPEDVQKYYPNCDAFIVGANLIEYCEA